MKEFEVKILLTEQDVKSLVAICNHITAYRDQCLLSVLEVVHLRTIIEDLNSKVNQQLLLGREEIK